MALEAWALDGIQLTSGSFLMMSLTADPPKAKPEWVSGADSEWATLMAEPLHENREFTMRLRIPTAANMDAALDLVAAIRDKLRKAARALNGIPLVWTPHNSARSRTFDVLHGEITELPIDKEGEGGEWFKARPIFSLVLTAKPYWYDSSETLTSTTTSSLPLATLDVTGVGGDVPALGRLIVTDAATQPRYDVEWGLQNRDLNPAVLYLIDSDELYHSTSGYAGVGTTRSGAYDLSVGGFSVIRATLLPSPIAVCATQPRPHIGTFRVWGRFYVARQSQRVRLAWRVGDNRHIANDWMTPPIAVAGWCEIDLGTITIPTVTAGTQSWDARIDAYESDATLAAAALDVDYLRLTPAGEGYGRARGVFLYSPGLTVAYDQFTGASSTLSGHVAPLGGTWTVSLVSASDLVGSGNAYSTNQVGGDTRRYEILGSTTYTNIEVTVDMSISRAITAADGPSAVAWISQGVIARWVSSSDYVSAVVFRSSGYAGTPPSVTLLVSTPGATVASLSLPFGLPLTVRIRLIIYSNGLAVAQLLDTSSGVLLAQCSGSSSVLATGGSSATGRVGFMDTTYQFASATPPTRTYDNFVAATPETFNPVINSGQSVQFRHDSTLRSTSGGTYGEPDYRGGRFLVPPGTSRVAVAARRLDLAVNAADAVTDSTTVQVGYRNRGLVVPRA